MTAITLKFLERGKRWFDGTDINANYNRHGLISQSTRILQLLVPLYCMPWTKRKFLNYEIPKSFGNLKLAREKKRFKSDSSVLLCLLNHVSIFESGPKPFIF
jgi:hypothetical protein